MSKGNRKKYDYIDDNYTLAEIDYDEKQGLARYRQLVENRKQTKTNTKGLIK